MVSFFAFSNNYLQKYVLPILLTFLSFKYTSITALRKTNKIRLKWVTVILKTIFLLNFYITMLIWTIKGCHSCRRRHKVSLAYKAVIHLRVAVRWRVIGFTQIATVVRLSSHKTHSPIKEIHALSFLLTDPSSWTHW